MTFVEFDPDAGMIAPIVAKEERQGRPRGMDRGLAPYQDPHMKGWPAIHERPQQGTNRLIALGWH